MLMYTPEFLIYPFLFLGGMTLAYMITGGHPGKFSIVMVIWIIFWIFVYAVLTTLMNFGLLPCIKILNNAMGGCV